MPALDRFGRRVATVLSVVAVAWAVALPLAPFAGGSEPHVAHRLLSLQYMAGAFVCHQRPERSFSTAGVHWPVCARCSGLYLSAALGVVLVSVLPRRALQRLNREILWRPLLAWAALPTLASWIVERSGWWQMALPARAWLALPLGAAVGVLLAIVARGDPGDVSKT